MNAMQAFMVRKTLTKQPRSVCSLFPSNAWKLARAHHISNQLNLQSFNNRFIAEIAGAPNAGEVVTFVVVLD